MTLALEQYRQHDYKYSEDIIKAEIILDSMYPVREGQRLTTMLLTIPQIIHAELLRHRMFSFAVSSNRAVPFTTVLKNTDFEPVWREKAKNGMQPGSFVEDKLTMLELHNEWDYIRRQICASAEWLNERNIAKELTNRLLFPFQTINILVSATSFSNFFTLRDHKDAQFEIQILARRMKEVYEKSTPQYLQKGEWHMPFIRPDELNKPLHERIAVSVARCARTSYKMPTTNKMSDFDADINLFKKLITPPLHASPLEFVATPATMFDIYNTNLPNGTSSILYGNTFGWVQLRSFFDKKQYITNTFNNNYQEINDLRILLNNEK